MSSNAPLSVASPRLSRVRAFVRRVGKGLLVLAVVLAAVIAWFLRDLDGRIHAALVAEGRELEAVIGRRVSIGGVHVALGAVTEIVVRGVAVEPPAGAEGELAVPALRVAEARLAVALGPLIRSRGRAIEVTRFAIEGPEVNIVRAPGGLSIDDIRGRVAKAPKRPPAKGQLALKSLAITGGKIRLHELGTEVGRDLVIDQIALTGHDVGLAGPSHLSFGAAVCAAAKNLGVEIDLASTSAGSLALTRAELKASAIRIAPALRWARAPEGGSIDVADGEIDASVIVEMEPGAAIGVKGSVTLEKVRVAGGAPTAIVLVTDAEIDPRAGAIAARSVEIAMSGVTVHGSLGVHGIGASPAFDAIDLELSGDADAIRALLPPGRAPRGLAVRGPIAAKVHAAGSRDEAQGSVKIDVAEVRFSAADRAGRVTEGKPAAVSVAAQIAGSRASGALRVSEATVQIGEIAVRGGADLRGLGAAPVIESLSAEARGPVEAILDLVPPSRRPPGLALRGPLRVDLAAHGATDDVRGSLAIDLDGVAVSARGVAKPAGVPLGVAVEGRVQSGRVEIAQGEVRLGSLAMAARGWVRGEDLDIAFEPRNARGAEIAPLLKLAPAAAEKLAGRGAIDGKISVSGKVRRASGQTTIEVAAKLREARVRQALASIDGGVDASARVELSGSKSTAHVEVDLSAATIDVAPALTKRAGQPVRAAFTLTREGDRVQVRDAHASAPGLAIEGLTVDRDPARLRVSIAKSTIALAPLLEMVPLLRGRLPPALADLTVRFGVEVEAEGADLAAGSLRLRALELRGAIGRLTGAVSVEGLKSPRAVRIDVSGGDLDLSSFARKDGGADVLVVDTGVRVEAKVHLDSVKAHGETATEVDAEVDLKGGRVTVRSLRAKALGGTLEVARSYVDLSDVPEIELHAKARGIDLARFASERMKELELRGRASGEIDLRGRGLDAAQIARSLRGTARLELDDVRGKAHFDHQVKLSNPMLAKLQKKRENKPGANRHALALREVRATLAVDGGKVKAKGPIVVRSDDFVARLTGTIGSGADLALDGHVEIAPHVIADATKRALIPVRSIPLELRLFEDAEGRKVELRELRETVGALRGALRNAVDGAAVPVP